MSWFSPVLIVWWRVWTEIKIGGHSGQRSNLNPRLPNFSGFESSVLWSLWGTMSFSMAASWWIILPKSHLALECELRNTYITLGGDQRWFFFFPNVFRIFICHWKMKMLLWRVMGTNEVFFQPRICMKCHVGTCQTGTWKWWEIADLFEGCCSKLIAIDVWVDEVALLLMLY